jgi:hypothetical protein
VCALKVAAPAHIFQELWRSRDDDIISQEHCPLPQQATLLQGTDGGRVRVPGKAISN